jgi:hypothetical protein
VATETHRLGFRNSTVGWLTATGTLWLAGYAAYLSSWDVPIVPRMRPLADLSWGNWVVGGLLLLAAVGHALWPRKVVESGRIGNRWAAPAMVTCAIVGLVWIVIYYTLASGTTVSIPYLSDAVAYLQKWNLVIGMGFIIAAFGFAMKWE